MPPWKPSSRGSSRTSAISWNAPPRAYRLIMFPAKRSARKQGCGAMNKPDSYKTKAERRKAAIAKLIRAARELQSCHQWTIGLPQNYQGRGPGNALADALDELLGLGTA